MHDFHLHLKELPQLPMPFNPGISMSRQISELQNVIQDFQSEVCIDNQDAIMKNCAIVFCECKDFGYITKANAVNDIHGHLQNSLTNKSTCISGVHSKLCNG